MPKLVRSRTNYHSLSVPSSPSSSLPSTSPQHAHGTTNTARNIPCLRYYSPMTPPWDTYQQRTVSEEDMCQKHATTIGSRKEDESRDGCSSSSSSENDCDQQRISHSLSSVSSASSSTTLTTNLKRRKPSVCLTDLVQPENKVSTACIAAVSPIMTNLNHCANMRSIGAGTSPTGWWGHFTTTASGDDCFAIELDDEERKDGILNVVPLHEEEIWDYVAMAHATSFIPLQRPYRHNRGYYTNIQANSHINPSLGDSGSNSTTTTSWRVALTSSYHPYINKNRYPMVKRQSIRPLSSTFQRSLDDRCTKNSSAIHPEQQRQHPPPILQSSSSLSASSSSFDEFILVCPRNHSDDSQTECNMDIATQRMSVLGL